MNRLAAMETFVRVVETGSFSAAARDLKLGQPAVSKTIAQLEKRLGVQLLLRSTHRLAPTEAGQQFFARAGEPTGPEDLQSHQAIVYAQRGGGAEWRFRQGDVEIPVTLKGRVRVNAAEGVREAVFAGLGIAVASEWMFAPELRSGNVRSVLRDWTLPPVDLWAIFPTGRRASAKARAFAAFIEERLSAEITITRQPA
jgi:DNA-binding transcriptional LysR family regulator